MAIFLPALNSKNLRLTPGERRFGTCLLRKLEDDYHVWINVPVGQKQFRPDYVLLHPGRGILVLEIKDWKLPTIRQIDRFSAQLLTDRGLITEANPLEQARGYAIEITRLLERDPLLVQQNEGPYRGHLLLPWGFGVVLTNISRRQFDENGLDQAIPGDRVICQDEITESVDAEAIQSQLWGMFQYSFGGVLSLARIDRVRWHLFPEIRIKQGSLFDSAVADAPDPTKAVSKLLPDMVKIMDLEQEKIARNLGKGHRIIHGVAGSGKTLLLAYRCLHLHRQELSKPILVLCYNKTLAAKLKAMLADKGTGDSVHVRHFHGWCADMCRLYQLDLPTNSRPLYEKQVEAVIAGAEKGRVPCAQYAAVLIDEGHDFEPDWFKLLVQMIDPQTNSLLLLYDDAQNIYGKRQRRPASWASLGIEAKGRTTILRVNYRNTVEALDFSYRFLSAYVDEAGGSDEIPIVHPEFGGRSGQVPEVIRLPDTDGEIEHLAAWLKGRFVAGVPYHDMAILGRFNAQIDTLQKALVERGIPAMLTDSKTPSTDAVRLLTMHSSKGLEFNSVAILDLGCMPCAKVPVDDEARLLYVALTRSTERLLVSYHTESQFTKQLEKLSVKAGRFDRSIPPH